MCVQHCAELEQAGEYRKSDGKSVPVGECGWSGIYKVEIFYGAILKKVKMWREMNGLREMVRAAYR